MHCANHARSGVRGDADTIGNLRQTQRFLEQCEYYVNAVEAKSFGAWYDGEAATSTRLGAKHGVCLGWLLSCAVQEHVYVIDGARKSIEGVFPLQKRAFLNPVGAAPAMDDVASGVGDKKRKARNSRTTAACGGEEDFGRQVLSVPSISVAQGAQAGLPRSDPRPKPVVFDGEAGTAMERAMLSQ